MLLSDEIKYRLEKQEVLIESFIEFYERIRDNQYESDKMILYLDRFFNNYQKAKEIIK